MSKSKTIEKSEYDIYLDELLNLIREKGTLVEVMPKGTSFLFDIRQEYKKMLGAVALNDKHGNVTNIYVAYEDFDGSIKYYDYPEYTRKEIKKLCEEMFKENGSFNMVKNPIKNLKQHINKGIDSSFGRFSPDVSALLVMLAIFCFFLFMDVLYLISH